MTYKTRKNKSGARRSKNKRPRKRRTFRKKGGLDDVESGKYDDWTKVYTGDNDAEVNDDGFNAFGEVIKTLEKKNINFFKLKHKDFKSNALYCWNTYSNFDKICLDSPALYVNRVNNERMVGHLKKEELRGIAKAGCTRGRSGGDDSRDAWCDFEFYRPTSLIGHVSSKNGAWVHERGKKATQFYKELEITVAVGQYSTDVRAEPEVKDITITQMEKVFLRRVSKKFNSFVAKLFNGLAAKKKYLIEQTIGDRPPVSYILRPDNITSDRDQITFSVFNVKGDLENRFEVWDAAEHDESKRYFISYSKRGDGRATFFTMHDPIAILSKAWATSMLTGPPSDDRYLLCINRLLDGITVKG